MFELSTDVPNLQALRGGDYDAFDALYLGDFSCPDYPKNFSSHPETLAEGVRIARDQGKRCYLRLYAVPSNHELDDVRRTIDAAMGLPFDAFEVHNMGLLRVLREMGCTKPLHLGVFGNLYTHETARVLKDYGVTRVYPNPELSLREIRYIKDETPIEVLVQVHGKIPLVISETCFIMENAHQGAETCSFFCSKSHWLTRSQGDWSLKDAGRMTLSGKDLCMIEHMDRLAEAGLEHFFVHGHGEERARVAAVGRAYRRVLNAIAGGEPCETQGLVEALSAFAEMGLCNGYYFESAGQHYVGRP
ncbi:peptidase U32 family protein [Thiorhodococcus minor]|uniref:U32 family peptidase n=1 Tax=Thiorhodococcus minor TaxID=57489 RepID=A0A6M0K3F1_9GAMM|nr:peptidase U32 family protein [Thiorhodococcus minor]NEV63929.1 U32 family peptidase [Thiorhodococcus minor]